MFLPIYYYMALGIWMRSFDAVNTGMRQLPQ